MALGIFSGHCGCLDLEIGLVLSLGLGGQGIFSLRQCLLAIPVSLVKSLKCWFFALFSLLSCGRCCLLIKLVLEPRFSLPPLGYASRFRLCSKLMFVGSVLASTCSLVKLVGVFMVQRLEHMARTLLLS